MREQYQFPQRSLFTILFNYLPHVRQSYWEVEGMRLIPEQQGLVEAKYDLNLYVEEGPDDLLLKLIYKTAWYSEAIMARLLKDVVDVVQQVLADDTLQLDEIKLQDESKVNVFSDIFEDELDNDEFIF
jgi:hypothetical protein